MLERFGFAKLGVRPDLLGGAVIGASLTAVAAAYCFPGAFRRFRSNSEDAAWWAKCCLQICSKGPFAKASRIYDLVTIDDVAADGTIRARLRVNEGVCDIVHRLHCGAAALIVDELTTASIISQRSVAGVSISMSLTFCAEAAVGAVVHVESKVVRLGRRLVHTEATFTLADGTPVLRASHLKFCEATWAWLPIVWIRTALARRLAPLLAKPAPLRSELAAASPPSLPALDDRQKSAYFGELGHNVRCLAGQPQVRDLVR
jgi:acyl-coenzyme A thioesterase PaaI-like protein